MKPMSVMRRTSASTSAMMPPHRGKTTPWADHAALWRRNPGAIVALNIRDGNEAQLIECLRSLDVARQVFLFDMELVEPMPGEMAARFRPPGPRHHNRRQVSDPK